ncbi:response regulator [Nodosilinea sp. LEGE 06152]|uniref:response regulator n=1 Tax=Nodosilinea sp. LEGE 06152 TaxID=2777966 RepID=UPI00187E9AD1|nr:response regulator [Nodosilinea sp. LEGE 06152]MBE9157847.1 response regulator [Nodosilinea sp. LEGE 06152]
MQDHDLERERFILVIDPNRDHAQVVQQVLGQRSGYDSPGVREPTQNEYPSRNRFEILVDGGTAIDYLLQRGEYAQAPRPDLVLLDLDLPDDGYHILTTIKTTPHLKRIPVIVFTESDRTEDVLRSYTSQSNCYVVKAADIEQLSHTVKQIEAFWLEIVTLPLM